MIRWGIVAVTFFGLGFVGFSLISSLSSARNSIPKTVLSLSTNNLTPHVGQYFDLALNIDTDSNTISQAVISLEFDQRKVKFESVVPGVGFSIITDSIDEREDTLEFRIEAKEEFTGSQTMARLRLNALSPGPVNIDYGNRTIVGASSELGENVLMGTSPITIMIK